MLQALKQPYPFHYTTGNLLRLSVTVIAVVSLFLWFFRPLDIDSGIKLGFPFICMIYGLVAGVLFYFVYQLIPGLFAKITNQARWTLAKEICGFLLLVVIAGNCNYLLGKLINTGYAGFDMDILLRDMVNTFLVATVPMAFISARGFLQEKPPISLNTPMEESSKPVFIELQTPMDAENLTLEPSNLLLAKADGNYVEFYVLENQEMVRHIRRTTIKSIEDQLSAFDRIIRTHRGYLLNLDKVKSYTGNSSGIKVVVEGYNEAVPVSRAQVSAFLSSVK